MWKHRGPCRVDSDVSSEGSPVLSDQESPSEDTTTTAATTTTDTTTAAGRGSDAVWPAWYGQRKPLMFVCERCRALQTHASTLHPRCGISHHSAAFQLIVIVCFTLFSFLHSGSQNLFQDA